MISGPVLAQQHLIAFYSIVLPEWCSAHTHTQGKKKPSTFRAISVKSECEPVSSLIKQKWFDSTMADGSKNLNTCLMPNEPPRVQKSPSIHLFKPTYMSFPLLHRKQHNMYPGERKKNDCFAKVQDWIPQAESLRRCYGTRDSEMLKWT